MGNILNMGINGRMFEKERINIGKFVHGNINFKPDESMGVCLRLQLTSEYEDTFQT